MTDIAETIGRPALRCAQCGRPLPAALPERARWRQGREAVAGELDELTAAMLLCPDCAEDDRVGAYDAGEGD